MSTINKTNKISISDYLKDKTLLEVTYIPFDSKMQIVSHILGGIIESIGGLNSSLLRRISTEVFIDTITNIDMNIIDENSLKGFDQLCFAGELDNLKKAIGNEYIEFQRILDERVSDYIRTETNPSVTINAIYNKIIDYARNLLDYIIQRVDNVNIEQLMTKIKPLIARVGESNESK